MCRKLDKRTPKRQERAGPDLRSPEEVEQIVILERLHLYNRGRPCGAAVLREHLREYGSGLPLPSVRKIGQVLTRYGLTHGRTGWYEGEDPDSLSGLAGILTAERRCDILARRTAP